MFTPSVQGATPVRDTEHEHVFPWEVLHACDHPREILSLFEGQFALGMRPQIATPNGLLSLADVLKESDTAHRPESLLGAWNHVRIWRKLLGEADALRGTEVVHAHTFSAGMAAVRAGMCPVYDVSLFIDQSDSVSAAADDKSWLARSFRVAEQFILARAGAVVVHTPAMQAEAVRRGATADTLFEVPDPLEPASFIESNFAESSSSEVQHCILATDVAPDHAPALCTAFADLRKQIGSTKLLLMSDAVGATQLYSAAQECGVADSIEVHPSSDLRRLVARA
ncbi:MAG TPA: glycosyltransferase, partial [Terriglobales bacterium]